MVADRIGITSWTSLEGASIFLWELSFDNGVPGGRSIAFERLLRHQSAIQLQAKTCIYDMYALVLNSLSCRDKQALKQRAANCER